MFSISEYISGEFLLTRCKRRNGGGVILLRAIITTFVVTLAVQGLWNLIDPSRGCEFDLTTLQTQLISLAPFSGAIFGGIFLVLGSRYSSQYQYLANLYVEIKKLEFELAPRAKRSKQQTQVVVDLKAAFVEDAYVMHLYTHEQFATTIKHWLSDDRGGTAVKRTYIRNGRPAAVAELAEVIAASRK